MSSDVTLQSFALEMRISVDQLIKKFLDIGIKKNKFDLVTKSEKEILSQHIPNKYIESNHQFSLFRQTKSTLNVLSVSGKNKQVQVEVRKKRIYKISDVKTELNENLSNDIIQKKQIQLDTDHKLTLDNFNKIKKNKLLFPVEKKDVSPLTLTDPNYTLDNNANYKNIDASSDLINQPQQVTQIKNSFLNQYNRPFINFSKKKSQNHLNKLDNEISVLETNDHNYRLNLDKRYHSKIRSQSRSTGKLFKQKKNNNTYYAYDIRYDTSEKTEKLYISNRLNKNKRKRSTLIQSFSKPTQTISKNIVIGETISVLELSNKMAVKSSYMIKLMLKLGLVVTINQILDQETAQLVIEEMGHRAILRRENELEELILNETQNNVHGATFKNKENHIIYKNRAPIVTIMGHVDHGKTSLLDYIRSTKIASSELGGITQSIGIYRVNTQNDKSITFLDTPGHAAFMSMRIRGIELTDIAVLVIAADDGIMPQTIESIQHIKSINIPVIVAINKIDKIDINIDKIKNDLNHYGFIPEEWGGNTQFINISAISGIGVNDLLDAILLQSEMLELKTAYQGAAKAVVIESSLDKGRGPVIIALVQSGELKCGDMMLCGTQYGRVRSMRNEYGHNINIAYPSMPVEIVGLSGIPNAGDTMIVVNNEKKAREVALHRQSKQRSMKLNRQQEESFTEKVFDDINNSLKTKIIALNFIVKADTQGSMEAICESIGTLSTSKIIIKILFAAIGNITETDVVLASTSNATILGFNVKPDSIARRMIELNNIDIRYYSIIYDLLNEVKNMIGHNMLVPTIEPEIIGSVQVQNIFRSSTYGMVAGCIVIDGVIKSKKRIVVVRNNLVIHKGELASLRRFKNDVNEVKVGKECGISIKNYHDIQCGDIIKILDSSNISNEY